MVSDRDLATVLYALRTVQEQMGRKPGEEVEVTGLAAVYFTDVAPLTVAEIDAVCERLNTAPDDRITVQRTKALKLFTDWHVDEATSRREARTYAERLWQRLVTEAC